MNWERRGRKQSSRISRYYPSMCMDEVSKTTKILCQDSRPPGWESNLVPPVQIPFNRDIWSKEFDLVYSITTQSTSSRIIPHRHINFTYHITGLLLHSYRSHSRTFRAMIASFYTLMWSSLIKATAASFSRMYYHTKFRNLTINGDRFCSHLTSSEGCWRQAVKITNVG